MGKILSFKRSISSISMQKPKLTAQLLAGTLLFSLLVPFSRPAIVQAKPETRFLFDAQCVSTGPGRWRRYKEDVSVGRQVYTSYLYMGAGTQYSAMTCRIRPEAPKTSKYNFESLLLEFGMRDNDLNSPGSTVKVYLDGAPVASQSVQPGEKASLLVDVSNVSNVAIETVCSTKTQYCDRVYFFKATLEEGSTLVPSVTQPLPSSPAPAQTPNPTQTLPPPPSDSSTQDANPSELPALPEQ